MQKVLTWLTIRLLRSKKLTGSNKTRIMTVLLDNIGAFPITDIFSRDAMGVIMISGHKLDIESANYFQQGAIALVNNNTRKIIHDQIKYEAIKLGVQQGLNSEMIMFSKAVLWVQQEEAKLLASIVDNHA